jgi:nicotinamide mononucleotide transporter
MKEFLASLLKWVIDNYIEILATVTGLIYLVYSVKGNILLWFFGIITSALYVYVFYKSRIYADMSINIYYVIISIYGWVHWSSGGNTKVVELPISRLTTSLSFVLLIITFLIFILIAVILKNYTNSDIAIWDALVTSASITATWMLARKIMEHWLIWVVVDAISIGLYLYKGLYPTVLLFAVYTSLSVTGYFEWKKQWLAKRNI